MQPHSNPLHKQGEKNVFCPYYRKCLDYACEKSWEYFSCRDCTHRRTSEAVTVALFSPQNYDPYYALSPSLFIKNREFASELH
ncbi:MAG: hypothetical protein KKH68_12010 [Proteobacteria bacterium]|nr:hypothetical protein [Pseudomonadota bacterium]